MTCFRVGLRLNEPEMPKLLVSQHRPGFYFRVITRRPRPRGRRHRADPPRTPRAERRRRRRAAVPARSRPDLLRKAVDVLRSVPAGSSRSVTCSPNTTPEVDRGRRSGEPAWSGFRRLRVTATRLESPDVLSSGSSRRRPDCAAAATPRPVPQRADPGAGDPAPMRSYSLSGDPAGVLPHQRETRGARAGEPLAAQPCRTGFDARVAAPRGDFYLDRGATPVVLISAGIGVTPVLAMLHAWPPRQHPPDPVAAHRARSRHPRLRREVEALIASLPDARHSLLHPALATG